VNIYKEVDGEEDSIEDSPILMSLFIFLLTPVVFYNIKDLLYDGVVSICGKGGSCSYFNFDESPIAFCFVLMCTLGIIYIYCRSIIVLFRQLVT